MNTQQLRHFVGVVDAGTLGRAAAALDISQAGLTKSIQKLEQGIGGPLFRRSTNGMALTEAGRELLPHARLILRQEERATDAVGAIIEGRGGRLAIGAAPEWLRLGVGTSLLALRAARPDLRLSISSGRNTRALIADLRSGHLDVVVGVSQLDDPADIAFRSLATNRQGVIATRNDPLIRRRNATLADLVDRDWVLPVQETVFRQRFEARFEAAGLPPPTPVIETDYMPYVISCVAEGELLGTATAAMIAAAHEDNVGFVEIGWAFERPVGVMTRAEEPVTEAQSHLIDLLSKDLLNGASLS